MAPEVSSYAAMGETSSSTGNRETENPEREAAVRGQNRSFYLLILKAGVFLTFFSIIYSGFFFFVKVGSTAMLRSFHIDVFHHF